MDFNNLVNTRDLRKRKLIDRGGKAESFLSKLGISVAMRMKQGKGEILWINRDDVVILEKRKEEKNKQNALLESTLQSLRASKEVDQYPPPLLLNVITKGKATRFVPNHILDEKLTIILESVSHIKTAVDKLLAVL